VEPPGPPEAQRPAEGRVQLRFGGGQQAGGVDFRLSGHGGESEAELLERLREEQEESKGFAGRCQHGVMNPHWVGRLAWDLVVILLVLMDSMVLPFQLAYKKGDSPDAFDLAWLWITTSLFALDMALNFSTAYEARERDRDKAPGTLVTNRIRIAKHYLQSWFFIDLMSTVPWPQLAVLMTGGGEGSNSAQVAKLTKVVKFVRFLRLMRMLRLAKLATIWERIEARLGSLLLLQTVALVRVIFVIVAICHWNACIFWMVGLPRSIFTEMLSDEAQAAYEAQPHWTTIRRRHGPLEDEHWAWLEKDTAEAYVFCFYWTLGVMRTMPAEVTPVNLPERIFVLVFMFFALSAFAITVAQITQAFFKFSERRRAFNEEMAAVRMHLRSIRADDSLQLKVKAYLRHLFSRRRIQAKERMLLDALPEALKKRLRLAQRMSYLQKLEALQFAPKRLLQDVSELADVMDMLPGDVISRCGRPACATWILMTGRLQAIAGCGGELASDGAEEGCASKDGEKMRLPSIRRSWSSPKNAPDQVQLVDQECLLYAETTLSSSTIIAVESSELLRIDRAKFQAFVQAFGLRRQATDLAASGQPDGEGSCGSTSGEQGQGEAEGENRRPTVPTSASTAAVLAT